MDIVIKRVIVIIAILLGVILIWGLIGSAAASDVGVTCDVGLKDALCWKWHTNLVGEIGQFLNS